MLHMVAGIRSCDALCGSGGVAGRQLEAQDVEQGARRVDVRTMLRINLPG